MIVVLRSGTVRARLGGEVVDLRSGTAVRIPAGMAHEFWNPGAEPDELLMIAFGPPA